MGDCRGSLPEGHTDRQGGRGDREGVGSYPNLLHGRPHEP